MIYWITGQPGAGKTIISNLLYNYLKEKDPSSQIFKIDGDEIRNLFSNKDYSILGRIENISTAQKISQYLDSQGFTSIVSLISPYIDQREEFKNIMGEHIKEIYLHTSNKRTRDEYKVENYQPPKMNFIDIDTTIDYPENSLLKIVKMLDL